MVEVVSVVDDGCEVCALGGGCCWFNLVGIGEIDCCGAGELVIVDVMVGVTVVAGGGRVGGCCSCCIGGIASVTWCC